MPRDVLGDANSVGPDGGSVSVAQCSLKRLFRLKLDETVVDGTRVIRFVDNNLTQKTLDRIELTSMTR